MRPLRVAVALVVLATTALACSSTSHKEHAARPERGDVLPAPRDVRPTQSETTSTTGSGATPAPASTLPPTRGGPGGTIKIGVVTAKPTEGSVLGYVFNVPDARPVISAAVAEVNERGGIAGRRVEVAIAEVDAVSTSEEDATRVQNEVCVNLTEDVGAFIVINLDGFGSLPGTVTQSTARPICCTTYTSPRRTFEN